MTFPRLLSSSRISRGIALVLCVLLSPFSWAGTASPGGLQVRLSLPWTELSSLLSKQVQENSSMKKNYSKEILNLGEFQTFVEQGEVLMTGLEGTVVQVGPGVFQVSSVAPRLQIHIPKIQIDQEIVRVVSGVPLRVRMKATCGPILIEQEFRRFEARLRIDLNELRLQTQFEQFLLVPQIEKLSVQSLNCEGPEGLSSLINQTLRSLASSPDFLSSKGREYFQPLLSAKLDQMLSGLVQGSQISSPAGLLATSRMSLYNLEQNAEGLTADFNWIFREGLPLVPLQASAPRAADGLHLQISKKGLDFLLREAWTHQKNEVTMRANDIPEFARVLGSRFLQFFIWPDLFQYSKQAEFPLSVRKPILKSLALGENQVHLRAQLTGVLQSYRDEVWWSYLKMAADVEGDWSVAVEGGQLTLKPDQVNLQSQVRFGEKYQKAFSPNTWIASSLASKVLEALLGQKAFSVALPEIQLSDKSKLKVGAFEMRDQNVFLLIDSGAAVH